MRYLFLLLFTFGLYAQQVRRCGTDEYYEEAKQKNPLLEQLERQANEYARKYYEKQLHRNPTAKTQKTTQIIKIPVVVHIVWNTPAQNLSDAQVQSQIDVLNEDFRKLNADTSIILPAFQGLASDFQIEFCLATVDPNGQPTTGITRTQTSVTAFDYLTGKNDIKSSATGGKDPWPTDQYLNIWVGNYSGGLLGFAQFPWQYSTSPSTDGVVVTYAYFGRGGTAQAPFDLGRTATHEIGHWLGLYHTFQDGCAGMTSSTCSSAGDWICDTPPQGQSTSGCPSTPPNTCSESPDQVDMYQNYMDYSDDACLVMFTADQKTRVYSMLNQYRSWVFNANTANKCAPPGLMANISASNTQICPGGSITFTDASTGNPTSWSWSFPGGTPSSSSQQNPPAVTYNTAGTYNVTLTVSDGTTTDDTTITITVAEPAGISLPFTEDFESGNFSTNNWTLENPDGGITWQITTVQGSSPGSKAAFMDFFNYNSVGQRDGLVTPYLDLKNASAAFIRFDHAYALYSTPGTYTDSLVIYVIDGCTGQETKVAAYGESGNGELATRTNMTNAFSPTGPDQWCTQSTYSSGCKNIDISAFTGKVVKVKFEGYCDFENNLYIDNINITSQPVGITFQEFNPRKIFVYPNPAQNEIYINNSSGKRISGRILSLTGQILKSFSEITKYGSIDIKNLAPGVYLLEFETPEGEKSYQRILKQ